eukprot:3281336-Pleurochrysis_carterae.AAC.1
MCGGQVEVWTPRSDKNSVNSLDRNSPALSLCRVPMMRVGRGEFLLAKADKCVLETAVQRAHERAGDVGVHQASRMRGLVPAAVVRQARRVGFEAGFASIVAAARESGRCIGRDSGQRT